MVASMAATGIPTRGAIQRRELRKREIFVRAPSTTCPIPGSIPASRSSDVSGDLCPRVVETYWGHANYQERLGRRREALAVG